MKALTLYQPWASLIAIGAKKIETRGWATKYRGSLAIHAAMNEKYLRKFITSEEPFRSALAPLARLCKTSDPAIRMSVTQWHHGCVLAIADLIDCMRIVYHPGTNIEIAKRIEIGAESTTTDKRDPDFGKYIVPTEQEIAFGDWRPGRYAWILENVRIIEPVPAKGHQRIWDWETRDDE